MRNGKTILLIVVLLCGCAWSGHAQEDDNGKAGYGNTCRFCRYGCAFGCRLASTAEGKAEGIQTRSEQSAALRVGSGLGTDI